MAEEPKVALVRGEGAAPASPPGVDYESLRAELGRAVARVCPAWLTSERDDITQAALLKVMALVQREPGRPLAASYLWRIAYCETVDEIRRRRRMDHVPLEDTDHPSHGPGTDSSALRQQMADALRACVGALADERRRAVTLYLQGHGVTEIARILGWNTKRAENLVGRGIADTRLCLGSKGFKP